MFQDESENGLYCPTVSGTPPGPYTGQEGFLEYYEIMQAFNNDTLPWLPGGNSLVRKKGFQTLLYTGATPHGWTTVTDGCYLAPYSYNGPYWVNIDS